MKWSAGGCNCCESCNLGSGASDTLLANTDETLLAVERNCLVSMPTFSDYPDVDGDTVTVRFGSVVTFTLGIEIERLFVPYDECLDVGESTFFTIYQYVTDGTRRFDYNIVNHNLAGNVATFPSPITFETPDVVVREGVIEWLFDGTYAENPGRTTRYFDAIPYAYEVDGEDLIVRSPTETTRGAWSATRLEGFTKCGPRQETNLIADSNFVAYNETGLGTYHENEDPSFYGNSTVPSRTYQTYIEFDIDPSTIDTSQPVLLDTNAIVTGTGQDFRIYGYDGARPTSYATLDSSNRVDQITVDKDDGPYNVASIIDGMVARSETVCKFYMQSLDPNVKGEFTSMSLTYDGTTCCADETVNSGCPESYRCETVEPWHHIPYDMGTDTTAVPTGKLNRYIYTGCEARLEIGEVPPTNVFHSMLYTISQAHTSTGYEVEGWPTEERDAQAGCPYTWDGVAQSCTSEWTVTACETEVDFATNVVLEPDHGNYYTPTGGHTLITANTVDCGSYDPLPGPLATIDPFTVTSTFRMGFDSTGDTDLQDPGYLPPSTTYTGATQNSYYVRVGDPDDWDIDDMCQIILKCDVKCEKDDTYTLDWSGFTPELVITEAMKNETEVGARAWNVDPNPRLGSGGIFEVTDPFIFFIQTATWKFVKQFYIPLLDYTPGIDEVNAMADAMANADDTYYYDIDLGSGVTRYEWTAGSSSGSVILGDHPWEEPVLDYGIHGQATYNVPTVGGITSGSNTLQGTISANLSCVGLTCSQLPDGVTDPDDDQLCGCYQETSTYENDGSLISTEVDVAVCISGNTSTPTNIGLWNGENAARQANDTSVPYGGGDNTLDKVAGTLTRNAYDFTGGYIPESWNCLGSENGTQAVWGSIYSCQNATAIPQKTIPIVNYQLATELAAINRNQEIFVHSWVTKFYTASQVQLYTADAKFPRKWNQCWEGFDGPTVSWLGSEAYSSSNQTTIPMVTGLNVTISPQDPYLPVGLMDWTETWTVQDLDLTSYTLTATPRSDFR